MRQGEPNEIDLITLFSRIAWIARRNYKFLVAMVIFGFALGFGASFIVKKEYESQMIISSNILTYSYIERIVGTVNDLLKERDYQGVSTTLGIDIESARQIRRIEVEPLVKETGQLLPENERTYMVIRVRTLSISMLKVIQQSILKYLQDNEYVKIRVEQKKQFFRTLLAEVEREMKSLQDLKGSIYSGQFFKDAKGNITFDPTTVNSKILDLAKLRMEHQQSLELVESVQLVEGFVPHYRPVSGGMVKSSVFGGIIGLLIGILVITLRLLDREIRNRQPVEA